MRSLYFYKTTPMKKTLTFFLTLILLTTLKPNAQTPGIIVRPAGSAGPVVLDPNLNGYTSIATSGFGTNDILNSEVPYKIVRPLVAEPTGDLLRGPSGIYSDIVKTFDGSGFYLYTNATNLLCRLRIGGIVSGSKGYSILLDTDQKFGPSGPDADPNFQAATNGINGNPGFEYEVVLETNFRVAVYNVDGTSTPLFVTSYPLSSNSQISVATTTDGGNPDYFYDFFVPFSAMGISSTTPIRAIATTVMSPGPAIGGPKSDIYGLSGTDYMADWVTFISKQPVFTGDALKSTGTGVPPVCTDPPIVNGPITPTAPAVTGTWTKSSFSSVSTATITLYKNGISIGTTSVTSGGTWTISVSGLANTDLITALAQGAGESQCLSSNEVTVNNCNSSTQTAVPVVTCSSTRGLEGTMASGARVKLYKLTSTGYSLFADDATTTFKITYPTATTWRYDDVNTQSGSACTGGPADLLAGAYSTTALQAPNCESKPLNFCLSGTTSPSTPTVSSLLLEGATTIRGTAFANSGVNLFIDGYFVQSVVASAGGLYNFTLAKKLSLNQTIEINAATTGSCASTSFTAIVSCYVAASIINTNSSKQIAIGSTIAGTSSAVSGTTITIYNAATLTSVGTTTVQSNGTWSLSAPTAASGTNYLARVTGSSFGNSNYSDTAFAIAGTSLARCGTITGPVSENTTAVAGTVTTAVVGTTVTLFVDRISVGFQTISGTAWSIPVNTTVNNTIYAGAVLTISITEANKTEVTCAATQTVDCATPTSPALSPSTTTISAGQTVTYTLSSTTSGILYSIRDNADAANFGESKFGNGSTVNVTSDPFNTPGTYTVKIKATSFSGANCTAASSATVVVTGSLPLSLTKFFGTNQNGVINLSWQTDFEQSIQYYEVQKSSNGIDFKKIGKIKSLGNSSTPQTYFYKDPEIVAGTCYYKLKIVEDNGSSKFSKIVIFKENKNVITGTVSPNPFTSFVDVDFETDKEQNVSIRLFDMMGRIVKSTSQYARKGTNVIKISSLEHLPKGSYIIAIFTGNEKVFNQILLKK